ncbi:MAG: DUF1028 domain-containing protein [Flavobacteriales bacterium]|nr:DUF1028 domain-containing protein [Flavobacteriales bacterium]
MKAILLALFVLMSFYTNAQDTFSICAFDPETGEVGSAGATCIESSDVSCIIISDVHPGIGVVHTQSYWLASNQNYGSELMTMNLTAQQIIDSLVANDAQNNPGIRQYGVIRTDGTCASFTGEDCFDYKNHIVGPNYAIQGNILLGQEILDSMETRFLNTEGTLACKLMAALQGANVVGADTRCEDFNTSSFSAFVRVAGVFENPDALGLDLTINTYAELTEPIDSLQVLFDAVDGCSYTSLREPHRNMTLVLQVLGNEIRLLNSHPIDGVKIFDNTGRLVFESNSVFSNECVVKVSAWTDGMYTIQVNADDETLVKRWVKE